MPHHLLHFRGPCISAGREDTSTLFSPPLPLYRLPFLVDAPRVFTATPATFLLLTTDYFGRAERIHYASVQFADFWERVGREGRRGERESTEGRKFDGGNSRKRKTVTLVAKWEKGRWIGATEEGRRRRKGTRPGLGQGRLDEGCRANEGFASDEIGYRREQFVASSESLTKKIYDLSRIFVFGEA